MPHRPSPYGRPYKREREALLAQQRRCALRLVCNGAVADSADHDPPLALHDHVNGSGCCALLPACLPCQHAQGHQVARQRRVGLLRRAVPPPSRRW